MSLDRSKLDERARELGICDEEIAARKAYLDFSDDDVARLKALHRPLAQARAEIINELYAHLLSFDETSALLGDEDNVVRLKQTQSAYFESLTAGEYGPGYARDRLRIGIAHQRAGLELKWYVGAYRKYLSLLFLRLWNAGGITDRGVPEATLSLLKIVFFDMGLAIDTYLHDREKTVRQKVSQLTALSKVAAAITSSLSLRQVLEEVMQSAIGFTESRASCIAFFHEETGEFKDWVTHGLSERFIRNMSFRRGGLADEAFSSGTHVLTNDLPGTRHRLSRLAREEGIRAFLCMPLLVRDQKLGVLYVYRDDRDDFDAGEIDLIGTFAHLAAGAISNARLHARMTDLAQRDGLTGLYNRRSFDERLSAELERSARYGRGFALLMLDVDHFKRINDAHGHQAGDAVLKFLADLLQRQIRSRVDMVARFGGEEFAVLLPETGTEGALCVAERIRTKLDGAPITIPGGAAIGVTASIGACCYPDRGDSAAKLVENADKALYAAKQQGRNRTVVSATPIS